MKFPLSTSLLLLLCASSLMAKPVIRVNGSSTLTERLRPIAAQIAQAHEAELQFTPNGVGNGLIDLVSGKAEVALVVGPVDYFIQRINAKTPGFVDPAKLKVVPLSPKFAGQAALIAHPGVSVSNLSRQQVEQIFCGQITNWKRVGGPDLPVVPVFHDPMNGYSAVLSVVYHADPSIEGSKCVERINEVSDMVAATPGAISFVSKAMADKAANVAQISTFPAVTPVSYVVTLGEPSEPVKAIISDLVERSN